MIIVNFMKSFLGYIWVVLAITISIVGFKNMGDYEQLIAQKSGLRLSENWAGGKVDTVVGHPGYITVIHHPVFAGLIGRPNQGFIKIDWVASGNFPKKIDEKIDINHDRRIDFAIYLDTVRNKVILQSFSNQVIGIQDQEVLVFKNSRSVRVQIKQDYKGQNRLPDVESPL